MCPNFVITSSAGGENGIHFTDNPMRSASTPPFGSFEYDTDLHKLTHYFSLLILSPHLTHVSLHQSEPFSALRDDFLVQLLLF